MDIERHPLQPFIPEAARLLMLGSFPPARHRWSMDFFYPNFQNDMWRIFGEVFFADKLHFVDTKTKTFRREEIISLLTEKGIALYDTATEVKRTRNTASDKDLEVVTPTDLDSLIARIPMLETVVTTGQKATELFASHFNIPQPKVGGNVQFTTGGRNFLLWRMPSSSRAYPMSVEKKSETYSKVLAALNGEVTMTHSACNTKDTNHT
ncbi:MAG: uracil-DNA glycosylase family protein [Prevotella sp.]|uniref:uracil-DNA glycosylase family protein n=1 Tax=Prevotella sp. TaxID=59823 RepID=UPI002A2BC569|nr:uracil-DNA glycosylase family protein [Prevotella sp.]MDD7317469.1 uracil-DNA glycosylase family protein [Prevotellaceae bacterium]MDY4019195.1 uracil-DNA glycosylase family protein [Prevotella sp.]